MDGRQSGCYAPEPGAPPSAENGGAPGWLLRIAGTHDPLLSTEAHTAAGTDPARSRRWGLGVFLVALLPALTAIWANPWFVTQDGPAHLYNAHIIARSGDPRSPFRDVFEVRREPLP